MTTERDFWVRTVSDYPLYDETYIKNRIDPDAEIYVADATDIRAVVWGWLDDPCCQKCIRGKLRALGFPPPGEDT